MRRFARLVLPVAVLSLMLGAGCTKVPKRSLDDGPLDFDAADLAEAIPAAYGDLVAVTATETFPGWAQLWFQDEDGRIVTVYLNYVEQKLEPKALVIPRS